MTGRLITLPIRLYARGVRLALHAAEDVTGHAVNTTLRVVGTLTALRPGDRGQTSSTAPPSPARPRPEREQRANGGEPDRTERPDGERPGGAAPRTERPAPSYGGTATAPRPEPTPEIPADPRRAETEPTAAEAPPEPAEDGATEELAHERLEREGIAPEIDLDAVDTEPAHVSEEPTLVREEAELGAEDGAGASIRIDAPWDGYDRMGAREVVARLGGASAAELAAVQLYESAHRKRPTVLAAAERQLRSAGRGR